MKRSAAVLALAAGILATGMAWAEDLPMFRIELKDGVVSPQRLQIPVGKPFRLEVRNTGRTAAEFESKPLKKEKVVVAGATTLLEIKAVAAGEYPFVDEFHENLPTGRGLIVAK